MANGLEHERLPKEEEERKQYANQVGADGWMLLQHFRLLPPRSG